MIISKINKFDNVTQFRLKNLVLFCIGYFLITPIITDLKGEYLAAWAISLFLIGEQLLAKTNRFFVESFSTSYLYKMGIFVHVLFTLSAAIYFISPLYMVIFDSIVALIEIAIFGAYSIKLTNYLTENYPDMMSEFQIIRNSLWADGVLIGLALTTIITYFGNNEIGIICFIMYNICFSVYLFSNWHFFDKLKESNVE